MKITTVWISWARQIRLLTERTRTSPTASFLSVCGRVVFYRICLARFRFQRRVPSHSWKVLCSDA